MKKNEKRCVPLEKGEILLGTSEECALLEWSHYNHQEIYTIRKTFEALPVTIQDPTLLQDPQLHPGKRIAGNGQSWTRWIYGPAKLIDNLFIAKIPTRTQKMRRLLAAKTAVLQRIEHEEQRKPNSGAISPMKNGELKIIESKIGVLRCECMDIVEEAHQNFLKQEIEAIQKDRRFYCNMIQGVKNLAEQGTITKQEALEEIETYKLFEDHGHAREHKLFAALPEAQKKYLDAWNALQLFEEEKHEK